MVPRLQLRFRLPSLPRHGDVLSGDHNRVPLQLRGKDSSSAAIAPRARYLLPFSADFIVSTTICTQGLRGVVISTARG